MKSVFICLVTLFLGFCPHSLWGQKSTNKDSPIFITVKPQSFFVGANIGTEIAISNRISAGGELTGHFWFVPSNLAIAPIFKYYFKGKIGKGFYARGKLVGGYYFMETPIDSHPYYAGAGIGVGGITSLCKTNKIALFVDLGLKFVVPFGNRHDSQISDASWGMAYYSLLSPASMPEIAIGVAFRL